MKTAGQLDFLSILGNTSALYTISSSFESLVSKSSSVFLRISKLKKFQLELNIVPLLNPFSRHLHHFPFHSQKKVGIKLKELLDLDIIESVTEPMPLVSPLIAVTKNNNDIQIVIDMHKSNLALYLFLMNILKEYNGCMIFSRIGLEGLGS